MAWAWPQTWVFHSENCHAGLKLCDKVQNRKPGFKPRVVYQNDNAAACREHISQQAAWARHFSCVADILTQPSTSSRLQLSAMIAPTPVPPPSPATTTSQQNTSTMVPSTSCSPFLTSNLLFPIAYFLRQDSYTASWPNNILSPRMSHSMILLINRVVHIGQDKSTSRVSLQQVHNLLCA